MPLPRFPALIDHPGGRLVWFLPWVVVVGFVLRFAGPLPLTDEWTYTHVLRMLHHIDLSTLAGWKEFLAIYPIRHSEHLVAFPFLIYAPVAELTGHDARWIIQLTLAAFGLQAWVYCRKLLPQSPASLLIVLLLFCPSHYMEFLWGWQFTLTLSATLPLLGLVLISRANLETSFDSHPVWLVGGLVLIGLGAASSAGGFFGFPAAVLLAVFGGQSWRQRAISAAAITGVAILFYVWLLRSTSTPEVTVGPREFWYVLTAIGITLWGSPVGLTEFKLDAWSAAGGIVVLAGLVTVIRAIRLRQLGALALPLCVAAFGFLCVIPIAISRPYLGNWHVQYALPIVGGIFAATGLLRRIDTSVWTRVTYWTLAGLLVSCLFGYWRGFTTHGPAYASYIEAIEDYTLNRLPFPERQPPYPPQNPARDMDLDQILFLAAHGNPAFPTPAKRSAPLAGITSQKVYLGPDPIDLPHALAGPDGALSHLTVVLEIPHPPLAISAQVGDTAIWMPRVNDRFVPEALRSNKGAYYMAAIMPKRFKAGDRLLGLQEMATTD